MITESVKKSFDTKSYLELKILWKIMETRCLNDEKIYMFDEFYTILGGN